jgi:TPR repeat protein
LGVVFYEGCGTPNGQQDLSECESCWLKASTMGNAKAAFSLACMYHKGEVLLEMGGEEAQRAVVRKYMSRASQLGHTAAQQALEKVDCVATKEHRPSRQLLL